VHSLPLLRYKQYKQYKQNVNKTFANNLKTQLVGRWSRNTPSSTTSLTCNESRGLYIVGLPESLVLYWTRHSLQLTCTITTYYCYLAHVRRNPRQRHYHNMPVVRNLKRVTVFWPIVPPPCRYTYCFRCFRLIRPTPTWHVAAARRCACDYSWHVSRRSSSEGTIAKFHRNRGYTGSRPRLVER